MENLTELQINEIVDFLTGTDADIDYAVKNITGHDASIVSQDSIDQIYDELFICADCGFWTPQGENMGGSVCDQCLEEYYDEQNNGCDRVGEGDDRPNDEEYEF